MAKDKVAASKRKKKQYYRRSAVGNNNNNKRQKKLNNVDNFDGDHENNQVGSDGGGGHNNQQQQPPKSLASDMESHQGFLISCNYNEYQCLKEAYNLLNDIVERLNGSSSTTTATTTTNTTATTTDIDASIEAELATLRNVDARKFSQLKTKCNNVLFVRINQDNNNNNDKDDNQIGKQSSLDPNSICVSLFEEIMTSKRANSRYIQRILPVMATFKAPSDLDKMQTQLEQVLKRYAFDSVGGGGVVALTGNADDNDNDDSRNNQQQSTSITFCAQAKVRNNSTFTSETELKKRLCNAVRVALPNWKLQWSGAEVEIIVNVVNRAVCVSVVTQYVRYAKYNLMELCKRYCGGGGNGKGKLLKMSNEEMKKEEEVVEVENEKEEEEKEEEIAKSNQITNIENEMKKEEDEISIKKIESDPTSSITSDVCSDDQANP